MSEREIEAAVLGCALVDTVVAVVGADARRRERAFAKTATLSRAIRSHPARACGSRDALAVAHMSARKLCVCFLAHAGLRGGVLQKAAASWSRVGVGGCHRMDRTGLLQRCQCAGWQV